MKKTGQLLREARESKDLTITEISHVTKINPKTIEALENGDSTQLPQKAFVRGFVQTYAKYLGMDVGETLKIFQDEVGLTKPSLPTEDGGKTAGTELATRTRHEFDADPTGKSRKWIIVGSSIALIILIIFTFEMIKKYEKEGEIPKNSVLVADGIELSSSSTSTTLLEGTLIAANTLSSTTSSSLIGESHEGEITTTSLETSLAATPKPALIAPVLPHTTTSTTRTTTTSKLPTTTLSKTTTTLPKTTTTLKTVTTTSKTTTTLPKASTTTLRTTTTTLPKASTTTLRATTTTLPKASTTTLRTTTTTLKATTTTSRTTTTTSRTTSTTLAGGKPFEVIVEALDGVSVSYRIDNGSLQTLHLAAGQVHAFKGKINLSMDISDGGAVNVIYNGQDRGIPGALGQSLKLKFP